MIIRPAHLGDLGFIIAGWASGMRRGCLTRFEPDYLYWPGQHALIKRILGSASASVVCEPEDPHKLHGCIVWQPGALPIVHWCFVKPDVRRKGLARALLTHAVGEASPVYCTQATKDFDRFDAKRFVHAPHLLWGIMPEEGQAHVRPEGHVNPESGHVNTKPVTHERTEGPNRAA